MSDEILGYHKAAPDWRNTGHDEVLMRSQWTGEEWVHEWWVKDEVPPTENERVEGFKERIARVERENLALLNRQAEVAREAVTDALAMLRRLHAKTGKWQPAFEQVEQQWGVKR